MNTMIQPVIASTISYLRIGSAILLFASLLSIVACTRPEAAAPIATFQIPELKPRTVALSPNEFKVYRGKYDELRNKLSKNPADIKSYVEMAQLFMNEARITGDHPYYYPASLTLLNEALRRDPNDFGALISKGSVELSLHNFKEAAAIGKRAAAISPHSNFPWGIICDASVELGDYSTALMAADSMVAIRPDLRSYSRISYLREIHGDLNGAIKAMDMAVKAGAPGREEMAWARVALGNLFLNNGDLVSAEDQFATAIIERPNYPFAYYGIAKIFAAKAQYPMALSLLDTATGFIPEFSFVEMKADIYRVMGDNAKADAAIEQVESMLAEDEAAGHHADKEFALMYANHNVRSDEALKRARKEYVGRPNNIDAQYALAFALYRAGNHDEASSEIAKALRMKTKNAEMIAVAGLIAHAQGRSADAQTWLSQALASKSVMNPLIHKEAAATLAKLQAPNG